MGSWAAPLSPFLGRGGLDLSPLERAGGGGHIRQGIRGQSRGAVFSFVKTSVRATPHLMWWGHPRGIQGTLLALGGFGKGRGGMYQRRHSQVQVFIFMMYAPRWDAWFVYLASFKWCQPIRGQVGRRMRQLQE